MLTSSSSSHKIQGPRALCARRDAENARMVVKVPWIPRSTQFRPRDRYESELAQATATYLCRRMNFDLLIRKALAWPGAADRSCATAERPVYCPAECRSSQRWSSSDPSSKNCR